VPQYNYRAAVRWCYSTRPLRVNDESQPFLSCVQDEVRCRDDRARLVARGSYKGLRVSPCKPGMRLELPTAGEPWRVVEIGHFPTALWCGWLPTKCDERQHSNARPSPLLFCAVEQRRCDEQVSTDDPTMLSMAKCEPVDLKIEKPKSVGPLSPLWCFEHHERVPRPCPKPPPNVGPSYCPHALVRRSICMNSKRECHKTRADLRQIRTVQTQCRAYRR
jgi:hypothetical protein